jgi:transcription initiation factor TFIIH subunit 1
MGIALTSAMPRLPAPAPVETAEQQQAPRKLRVVVTAADALSLSFSCDEDRDQVIDLLKQLKPAAAGAAGGPTPQQRQQLFASNRDLETMYSQLVVSGILTEADFWRSRPDVLAKIGPGGRGGTAQRQRAGLSSVLHDVERLHDGQTERVNIQLTPLDIQRIFTERPEVHRAFLAHVPHARPELDFWQRYFKLEYKKAAKRCGARCWGG